MQLNPFIWNNYKQTEQAKKIINLFKVGSAEEILSEFATDLPFETEVAASFIDDLTDFCTKPHLPETLLKTEASALFKQIVAQGITLTYENGETEVLDANTFDYLAHISIVSTWLYFKYPDFFKPYFFVHKFSVLSRIADTFGLSLPSVPLKRYKEQRFFYYFQLCEVFAAFQEENGLTPEELCAFLYDFAPKYLAESPKDKPELPQPTQVWWIGGDKGGDDFEFLDNPTPEATHFWQGNEDTKRGDILVMYCLSPRSYIHSVWRATADGIADPFFHYYSSIYIGHGQKVPPITIHELKADPHFSKNPLVRKNMQGINGYPLFAEDYNRLQEIIKQKGRDGKELPQLYSHTFEQNKELKNEREVELHLIEPMLEKVGFTSKDWVRQLVLRMGRGERNFPDYAFLTDKTEGYEKALMLIESKFWIKNNRELEETFKQVWSYGQRLSASIVVIADKDALWIYEKKRDAFDRTNYVKIYWKEIEQPDKFNRLKKLIGRR